MLACSEVLLSMRTSLHYSTPLDSHPAFILRLGGNLFKFGIAAELDPMFPVVPMGVLG